MKFTCPLGHKCRTTDTDGTIIEQCHWLVTLQGTNPQTGEAVDETACAIKYIPLLQVETTQKIAGVQAATESFRNEMVGGNVVLAKALKSASHEHLDAAIWLD